MRSSAEVFEFFEMIKPYIDRIMKDMDKGTVLHLVLSPGRDDSWASLHEIHKGEEYQHVVSISSDGTATNWYVNIPGLAS